MVKSSSFSKGLTSNSSSILTDEVHNCRFFPSFSQTDINQRYLFTFCYLFTYFA